MDQTPAVMAAPTTLPCPQIRSEPKDFCSMFLLLFLPSITGSKLTQGGRRRQAPIREWEGKATNKNEEGIAYGNQWNQPPGQVNNLTGNHRRIEKNPELERETPRNAPPSCSIMRFLVLDGVWVFIQIQTGSLARPGQRPPRAGQ
jgi:hypothetical protein